MKRMLFYAIGFIIVSVMGYGLVKNFLPNSSKELKKAVDTYSGAYNMVREGNSKQNEVPDFKLKAAQSDDNFIDDVVKLKKEKMLAQLRNDIAKLERETEDVKSNKSGSSVKGSPGAPVPHMSSEGYGYYGDAPSGQIPMPFIKKEYALPTLVGINMAGKSAFLSTDAGVIEASEGSIVGHHKIKKINSGNVLVCGSDKGTEKDERTIYPMKVASKNQQQAPREKETVIERAMPPVSVPPTAPAPASGPAVGPSAALHQPGAGVKPY